MLFPLFQRDTIDYYANRTDILHHRLYNFKHRRPHPYLALFVSKDPTVLFGNTGKLNPDITVRPPIHKQ